MIDMDVVRTMAQIDRDMDSGVQPYVVDRAGNRAAFPAEVLHECGCKSGQSVSDTVMLALLEVAIAHVQAQIALHKANS